MFSKRIPYSIFASPSPKSSMIFLFRRHSKARPDPETYLFRPKRVEVKQEILDKIASKEMKFRHHPGVTHLPAVNVPDDIQTAINRVLLDQDKRAIKIAAADLDRHMQNRRLPAENYDLIKFRKEAEAKAIKKEGKAGRTLADCKTDEERELFRHNVEKIVQQIYPKYIYNWRAMEYDTIQKCLTYCVGRFAPEYAAIRRCFNEIVKREPTYRPRFIFDFGSGFGATFFAAENSFEPKSVTEYVCVELHDEMVNLFSLLLRNGRPNDPPIHRNVSFRKYLPATDERTFDIVVSAFSLFELPSYDERMRTVANLWRKADNFLIIIERGTNAGFRAIIEARDYILAGAHEPDRRGLALKAAEHKIEWRKFEKILREKNKTEMEKYLSLREVLPEGEEVPTLLQHGHVFAPCPHEFGCPRLVDTTPCNFYVNCEPLKLFHAGTVEKSIFSYVILRKGPAPPLEERWPRIVRELKKRRTHLWCQTCSPRGVLEEKRFGKGENATCETGVKYRLVAKSEWGDLLPMESHYEKGEDKNKDEENLEIKSQENNSQDK